jgi:hypothetical protein
MDIVRSKCNLLYLYKRESVVNIVVRKKPMVRGSISNSVIALVTLDYSRQTIT